MNRIDVDAVNALRVLAADEVQKANSGHPGLPLGAAPAAYTVWAYEMKHDPKNYRWENRDRFILSGGHGSALLYALLLYRLGWLWERIALREGELQALHHDADRRNRRIAVRSNADHHPECVRTAR